MSARPNCAPLRGPGDFTAPDPSGHDDTRIRNLLTGSPKFVEEAFGEDVNWPAVARAWIDGDAIEVSRLLGEAVEKSISSEIERAIESFESDPRNNRHNPDGDVDPWQNLERTYGQHLRRTPLPQAPAPLDLVGFANGLMAGNNAQIERALGVSK